MCGNICQEWAEEKVAWHKNSYVFFYLGSQAEHHILFFSSEISKFLLQQHNPIIIYYVVNTAENVVKNEVLR